MAPAEGFFDDLVHHILEDDAGKMWMLSNRGIFNVSKQQLTAVARKTSTVLDTTVFSATDGMRSREGNGIGQPAGYRARDGRMWFSTTNGVAMINPQHLRRNPLPPMVVIEGVSRDKAAVPMKAAATHVLPAGNGELEFRYAALSMADPGNNRFKYRLDGYERDWQSTARRRVSYTNMPPGDYVFRVIGANNDGVWNETGASFAFRLEPHFYQTWWFYTLCAFGALGLVGAGFQVRVRHLRARESTLTALVDVRTKELESAKTTAEARESRQERIPGQYESRDPHADERCPRHDGAGARHGAGLDPARVPRNGEDVGRQPADDHQRHPGLLEDRSRTDRLRFDRVRPARGARRQRQGAWRFAPIKKDSSWSATWRPMCLRVWSAIRSASLRF